VPNWCLNRLAIAGPPAAVKLLVEELASPDAALDFAALRPTPPELLADQPVPAEGFPDWYEWRRTHWGVKWNASDVTRRGYGRTGRVRYRVMTPTAGRRRFLDFVAARYPEVAMSLSYDVEFWAVGWLPGPAAGVLASGGHA
jgi:hypothetical protein